MLQHLQKTIKNCVYSIDCIPHLLPAIPTVLQTLSNLLRQCSNTLYYCIRYFFYFLQQSFVGFSCFLLLLCFFYSLTLVKDVSLIPHLPPRQQFSLVGIFYFLLIKEGLSQCATAPNLYLYMFMFCVFVV